MPKSRKPWTLSVALISLGALTGCAQNIAQTVSVEKLCPAWPQVNVTRDDKLTAPTATTIEKSNIGREAMGCKYEKPTSPELATKAAPKAPPAKKGA